MLKEKRQAVISHAVTKGLNPDAPMRDSGVEWLGEVPAHWVIRRLTWCVSESTPIGYGILVPGPNVDGGVPYIGAGDVKPELLRRDFLPRTSKSISSEYQRSIVNAGELVYAIRGSFGNVEVVPDGLTGVNLSRDAARIAPKAGIDPQWLCWALKSEPSQTYFLFHATGAAVKGVNIGDLRRLPLGVPPRPEQIVISIGINKRCSEIDAIIGNASELVEILGERRTALISAAVTGKIDVRNWQAPTAQPEAAHA